MTIGIVTAQFGSSVLRIATPVLLSAMGAVIAGTAGLTNIGLEGIMLVSALAGVLFSAASGSVLTGVLGAAAVGMLMGLVMAAAIVKLKANQIIAGLAVNIMASGGTVFILYQITGQKGATASVLDSGSAPALHIPFLEQIPVLGALLSGHNLLTYIAFASVGLLYVFLYKTAAGFNIRAIGCNVEAAKAAGIAVEKTQIGCFCASGLMAGLGGAYLSMGQVSFFAREMVSGRGYIALAAQAVGMGNPLKTAIAALLFGFMEALTNYMQLLHFPQELIQMLPYGLAVLALAVFGVRKKRIKKEGDPA